MQLQDLVDFCEGRLSAEVLYQALLGPDAEALFADAPSIPPYAQGQGMVYYFLIEQDFTRPGDLLNVQSCLIEFLRHKGLAVTPSHGAERLYNILLKAQPAWLNAPESYIQALLQGHEGTEAEQVAYLKAVLREKFVCMKKPPKWLQDAKWPMADGEPLMFVGQMDISPLLHDSAQLYVFYDARSGQFHHIAQST